MKKFVLAFLHRGLIACGFGPVILAIVFLILRQTADVTTVTVDQLCIGIFSTTVLAFIVGGMNAIYQFDRLPLMAAILIHGSVLYGCYLGTYLLNGWLKRGIAPVFIFTGIFVAGYFLIWAIIYSVTRRNTEKVNQILKQKQQTARETGDLRCG